MIRGLRPLGGRWQTRFISDSFVSKVQAQNQNGSLTWDGQAEVGLDRGSAGWC